ncbi:MAG: ACT domain-containing protein [Calditrichaeota bacterium]|nr:MAG: ACT domain-containing protein [Calditrichota bacterium]
MKGETDLSILLATMRPVLHDEAYVFCVVDQETYRKLPFLPLCTFREREGITAIVTRQQAEAYRLPFDSLWAYIELAVHSSLSAVGFLAVISNRLAAAGISTNVISACYHDHLFVPWESRKQAVDILKELSLSQ